METNSIARTISILEIHDLRYIYTALSKPISQPGLYQFTAMGILDDRPIDFYNSEDKVRKPMQKWMEEHNDKDYWEGGTQSRKSKEQWSNDNINSLIERMHQNKSDVHILQSTHGCQAEKRTDGSLKLIEGFNRYGYDGLDFLSFNTKRMEWEAHVTAAESTKQKWDNDPYHSVKTKEYLEIECVQLLEKFVKYQEQYLQTSSPPKVHIFAKKSTSPDYRTLVCLVTGFFPKHVAVDILKNGMPLLEWDGVSSLGVMPNGDSQETYQLRKRLEINASDTSEYRCRILYGILSSPIEAFWDGECSNCDRGNTGAIVGGVVVFLVIVLVAVAVILFVQCRKHFRGARARINGENQGVENGAELTAVKSERNGSKGSPDSVENHSGKGSSKGSKEEVSLVDGGKKPFK